MSHFIVGLAGHIDHGKTSLVKALTGTNTDTLKEEMERQITIDIGFAFMGNDITIIDVPGHEKFIKNMLAGVATVDFALLVIAADDGVMPQTREHLDILKLLQISDGMTVITKIDKVEPDWLELVTEDIREYLQGSFLANKPIIAVDSLSMKGIQQVKDIIETKQKDHQTRVDKGIFRLPVDRVFTMKGYGTVVTGTIISGTINEGDQLMLQPNSREVRVRSIQCHGKLCKQLEIGSRAAVNLQGVGVEDVQRGDLLVTPGYLEAVSMFEGRLSLLASAKPLKHRTRIRFHAGTREILGRVYFIDTDELQPATDALVQIRLEEPVAISPRERFVLRSYSPQFTIGGGSVIRPAVIKSRKSDVKLVKLLNELEKGSTDEQLAEYLLQSGFHALSAPELAKDTARPLQDIIHDLAKLSQIGIAVVSAAGQNPLYLHKNTLGRLKNTILEIIAKYHQENPLRVGIPLADLKSRLPKNFPALFLESSISEMQNAALVKFEQNILSLADFKIKLSKDLVKDLDALFNQLFLEEFKPSDLTELSTILNLPVKRLKEVMQILLTQQKCIRIADDFYLTINNLDKAKELLTRHIKKSGSVKIGEVSDLLNSSRKYSVPLMEFLDKIKFTKREGDARVLNE